MTIIGYARVSTTDQSLEIQEATLRNAGCDLIRAEKRSGTTTTGREELRTVLAFVRAGDILIVTRIDRLARSIGDLQDIVRPWCIAPSHRAAHEHHHRQIDKAILTELMLNRAKLASNGSCRVCLVFRITRQSTLASTCVDTP